MISEHIPSESINPPSESVHPPPSESIRAPSESVRAPSESVHPPSDSVQTPSESVHPPSESVKAESLPEPEPAEQIRSTQLDPVPKLEESKQRPSTDSASASITEPGQLPKIAEESQAEAMDQDNEESEVITSKLASQKIESNTQSKDFTIPSGLEPSQEESDTVKSKLEP